jgi:hypothetical protein
MPQVRILYTDGTRDEFDVESEESGTASVVGGKVCVLAEEAGTGATIEVLDMPIEEVQAVVTHPGSESDGEIEMEETTIWSSPDTPAALEGQTLLFGGVEAHSLGRTTSGL